MPSAWESFGESDARVRPLNDVTIIDLSQNLAGPYCTQALGDLGATVIKVEPPAGDPARAWGPPFWRGDSTLFLSANRNKRSITLDLSSAADRAELDALVQTADVFVQAFRQGVIDKLGFGVETLRARDPRLIYCSITAYGDEGPLSGLAGYDPLMQAHAGLMSVTGHPGAPARVGTSIVDMGTGLWATIGILAALRERDVTGKGAHVSAALYETALAWNAYHMMGYLANGVTPGPAGTGFPLIAPYDAFPTSDGRLMIAAANDGLFVKLCDALGLHELRDDDRMKTNPQRVAMKDLVNRAVSSATRKFTTQDLEARLRSAGVPCAPVFDVAQVVDAPQTIASGMLHKVGMDGAPDYTAVAMPLKFDGVRPRADAIPPARA
jgi:crotonobetainyl-CoA:carnitine CoA-transferase CaiB-like acyl-CoA transferase